MSAEKPNDPRESLDVAIVGMAGRFPGAQNLEAFWRNLRDGVESIATFSDEELEALGVDPAVLRDPSYVKAGALLDEPDLFDAAFFGYSPREARILDPQQRVFLECAWTALENAGCDPDRPPGIIGVYAGTSLSSYLLFNLLPNPEFVNSEDSFQVMVANDKDFLATRVSYALDLDGPSIDVQTGCSTSLVAVHLACQGLLSYQTDVALAGGVSVHVPQRTGYYYQPGGITSPDGHCRAFDARAEGTIFGSGVGVVVLKRLADALADGDSIRAVIKGSAVNNDGSLKIGYTAPGLEGQQRVIEMAQAIAGVEPETIRCIEAHGTGTALGDPVEVSALTRAFRGRTRQRGFCALGSVKTNVGHLDAAAGVAGLIKTVLALEHRQLPPSLHFEQPNPQIELDDSPFYVNAELAEWLSNGMPRRAGVSSFGIGGTNAHVIVEEAPEREASGGSRAVELLTLSAKTATALDSATSDLAAFLREHPETELADVAHTLQQGRKRMSHRRVCVCRDLDDAVAALESRDPQRLPTLCQEAVDRPVVFMFPGGGAQYVDMARGLYDGEAAFREPVDACAELLRGRHDLDLFDCLYPAAERSEAADAAMQGTSGGLPALFAVEYGLARLWMSWGLRPEAMIGHSLGEYVAACLAGVFSLETALALVVLRSRLFEELPEGGMLGVPLPPEEVQPLLGEELSLAAVNGPAQCVVAGPKAALDELAAALAGRDAECRRIKIDVAAHSRSVEQITAPFQRFVETVELRPPSIPYVSNVTGTWMTADDAVEPAYWARHLRRTVRFGEGIAELLQEPRRVLLEVGPGQGLSTLVRAHPGRSAETAVLSSVRHPHDRQPDDAYLLTTLGRMWLAGVDIDWPALRAGERRRKVALPSYPFERQRYWIDPPAGGAHLGGRSALEKRADVGEWFYVPSWRRTLAVPRRVAAAERAGRWLVLRDRREGGLGETLVERLREAGREVIEVLPGDELLRLEDGLFSLRPTAAGDFAALLRELREEDRQPDAVAHLWTLSDGDAPPPGDGLFAAAQELGLYSLLALARAVGEGDADRDLDLLVVSDRLQEVESADASQPEKSTLLGACRVVPQEYPRITCRVVDVGGPRAEASDDAWLAGQLLAEVAGEAADRTVAYRGRERWVLGYEPVDLDTTGAATRPLREQGVYLVTGGLGNVGLRIARHLARTAGARLVLSGRSAFPERREWDEASNGDGVVAERIRRLRELESLGAELMIERADVSDEHRMGELLERIDGRFGGLHGVVHAAGIAGEQALDFIPDTDAECCERQFESKVRGLEVLDRVLADRQLDFCLLCSSNASVLGGLGSTAYAAANAFMDAFVLSRRRRPGTPWIAANWDGWLGDDQQGLSASFQTSIDRYAMTPDESVEAFERVVTRFPAGQVVVSTGDLPSRLDLWIRGRGLGWEETADGDGAASAQPRSGMDTPYVPPGNELEETIARVWQKALGIEQIGIHDNFFDLGGNSLIGLKVISRLRAELGVEIQVVKLFEGPTVAALAGLLGAGEAAAPDFDESRDRGEKRRQRRRRRTAVEVRND